MWSCLSLFPPQGEGEWADGRLVDGGCCGSGSGDFHCAPPAPRLGQLEWMFYYVTVAREVTDLPEISFRAGLEWTQRAGWRRRSEKQKHCTLLASTKPSSFNKPATRGSGGFEDWVVSCQTRWSLCLHHLSHVKVQDKFHSITQHGFRERLTGLGHQRESRRLPSSITHREESRAGLDMHWGSTFWRKERPPWCCRGGKSSSPPS